MGPLKDIKCLEVGGIGPAPFCGMMLSDMGAEVIRIDRKGEKAPLESKYDVMRRGRRAVMHMDLKKPEAIRAILKLVTEADVLFEGFRPGVMERLGLGPDICLEQNPRLVYGRVTGWGQQGPLSRAAGHDINYIALAGALHAIGPRGGKPVPPINLLGDFAGGGMLLAFGILCALLEAKKSGQGQVVDTAMVDGAALLLASNYGLLSAGLWKDERGVNLLDGGAHFYDAYETADGKYIAVGSIEPKFYELLLQHTGINDPDFKDKMNRKRWPELKEKIAAVFKTKTRDEWCKIMEGSDACFAPVLSLKEATHHPHNVTRKTFIDIQGVVQPATAPRFGRTRPEAPRPSPSSLEHTELVLQSWGLSAQEIGEMKSAGAI
ncbi:MAG: CoA transferase [Deltaproteobacteria bacterium]|nr:CoA transferase [Deltaproteobacteria bacterium]